MQTVAEQPEPSSPFAAVRARQVVLLWISPLLLPYVPGFNALFATLLAEWPWYWLETTLTWLYFGLLAGGLALLTVYVWRLPIDKCLGRLPTRAEVSSGLQLTAFTFVASSALDYLTFYPLSFTWPGFVQWWYIDSYSPLVYYDSEGYPLLPNLFGVLALCVVGPALEEISFRGILLPRWAQRWGLARGIAASSALFSVLHSDTLGAFVFAVAMCVLYMKSQSLTLPILCHGFYNVVVWLWDFAYRLTNGSNSLSTLEDFQASWRWGLVAIAVTGIWSIAYLRGPISETRWRLPVE